MKKTLRNLFLTLLLVTACWYTKAEIKALDINVSSLTDLQSALSQADATINITLTAGFNVTAAINIPSGKTVTITSDNSGPYTLERDVSFSDDMIVIASGASLTLSSITLDGNKGSMASVTGTLIENKGTFVMNEGVTLQNNHGGFQTNYYGGALDNAVGATATLNGGLIQQNDSVVGGGISNRGTMHIGTVTITHNTAEERGGGIFNDIGATLTTESAVVSYNTAGIEGGGIFNNEDAEITDTLISNNSAPAGGGIQNGNRTHNVNMILNNSQLANNEATVTSGGGILNNGTLTINDGSKIKENSAAHFGGGIYNMFTNTDKGYQIVLIINQAEIVQNTAENGGGVMNADQMTYKSGTISENTATLAGGGIYNISDATCLMEGGFVSENTATNNGGGILNSGTFGISGGAIFENSANGGGGIYNLGELTISDGEIFDNTALTGTAGGIGHYPLHDEELLITGGSIHDNKAKTVGGGIGVSSSKLSTLKVAAGVVFADNEIEGQPMRLNPADEEAYNLAIQTTYFTSPYTSLYNNVDVQYDGIPIVFVSFDVEGDSDLVAEIQADKNQLLDRPADPSKPGHVFDGWYKDDGYAVKWDDDKDYVNSSMTLYGRFKMLYTVNFISQSTTVYTQLVADGDTAVVPSAPVRPGYVFLGWYTSENQNVLYDFSSPVVESLNLYAHWQKESTPASPGNPDVPANTGTLNGLCTWYFLLLASGVLLLERGTKKKKY